ncbi:threo-3-hydroxy-L-aspartate ammonia-lyase [Allopusillimonas soli]|uniref:Threo-3-hydroxy-L-aspartate ammonia-lyase n=1 Tax=Allopusillimonas soli TaxID=659016 RepID=A0A853FAR5_9BURK|nr:threo-3-hydroxy-L-aspartate ammonia-lyase [Allopusillimonas soli]NYT35651.1 threo-3-hydroxy-L-aspartate ammonia-lyase [Allopusillimonas soli]TEA76045.1 threo-3-hydroxy-L-aspartate ammonia-lyase [Allopusillimonas soli]
MSAALPTYEDVLDASRVLDGIAHRTPVLASTTLNDRLGAQVFFKCENLQRIGAFKFRGGYNAIARLGPEQRRAGVVAFSSGNHAQAVALAARMLGVAATIVMPNDAPRAKRAATEGYGARIIDYDRNTEDREAIALDLAQKEGLTLIPPFDHPHIIAGQGTAVKELLEDVGGLDALFVPLGGGGLLSGSLLAARAIAPDCAVYGVEPEAGDDGLQSLRKGEIVRIGPPQSIADGAVTQYLGKITFPIIRDQVRDILTVSDAQLVAAMQFFAERMKIVVEPTGCLGAAAAMNQCVPMKGMRVGVLLSGGNVDLARYGQHLQAG